MPVADKSGLYRRLPSVDELLRLPELTSLVEHEGHAAITEAARAVLARVREEIAAGRLDASGVDLAVSGLAEAVERQLRQSLQLSLRSVINATGVVLHTNLGRAPLYSAALEHLRQVAATYSNLEFDVAEGQRGKRDVHVQRLFERLFESCGAAPPANALPWSRSRQLSSTIMPPPFCSV
jgi:L-seryl-tRNA(Ser) seleniumtransferase